MGQRLACRPSAGVSVTAVAAGADHTCAVSSGGGLWCWGWNGDGELGIGSVAIQYSPVAVNLQGDWREGSARVTFVGVAALPGLDKELILLTLCLPLDKGSSTRREHVLFDKVCSFNINRWLEA